MTAQVVAMVEIDARLLLFAGELAALRAERFVERRALPYALHRATGSGGGATGGWGMHACSTAADASVSASSKFEYFSPAAATDRHLLLIVVPALSFRRIVVRAMCGKSIF